MQAKKPKVKTEYRPLLYRFSRALAQTALKLWLRYETRAPQRVPRLGGCILAANHASFLDPLLVGCNLDHRFIRFIARDTLFHNRLFAWWARQVGVVMLDRTKGDIGAMKTALALLQKGGILCLFPEGTRSSNGRMQSHLKGGLGFLIAKAQVPVVPVYIHGSFRAFPRGARWIRPCKTIVYFGKPLLPETLRELASTETGYQQIAIMVREEIGALEQLAQR